VQGVAFDAPAAQLRYFCEKLSSHQSLQYVAVGGPAYHIERDTAMRLSLDTRYEVPSYTLRPFLSLRYLTEVFIEPTGGTFQLDDQFIAAMANAWPQLKILAMDTSLPMHQRSGTTLGGLAPLAQHFPKLSQLVLPSDMIL